MSIVVSFSTISNGSWIEEDKTPLGTTRVWRFIDGHAEWADLDDLLSNNPMPRWYGSCYTSKDFTLC